MSTGARKEGLSRCYRDNQFIGREAVLSAAIGHLTTGSGGLALLAAPGSGVSELLFRSFDRLFFVEKTVIPIYFSFAGTGSAEQLAARFIKSLITQSVAYLISDPKLLRAGISIEEALKIAPAKEAALLRGLWRFHSPKFSTVDGDAGELATLEVLSRSFDAAARANAAGLEISLLLDDVHLFARNHGQTVSESLFDSLNRNGVRFIAAGYRRFLYNASELPATAIAPLDFTDSAKATSVISNRFGYNLSDEVRDLVAEQFQGDLRLIEAFFRGANELGKSLSDFKNTQFHYVEEIFGGRCAQVIDRRLNYASSDPEEVRMVLEIASQLSESDLNALTVESAVERFGFGRKRTEKLFSRLNESEFFVTDAGKLRLPAGHSPQKDRLFARYRLEVSGENRALLLGKTVLRKIDEAPGLLAARYKAIHSLNLRGLLEDFSLRREVPEALIDYGRFAAEFKGAPDDEIIREIRNEPFISLPTIVFSTATQDIYPPIARSLAREKCAVGFGFRSNPETRSDEIWIAAEINSKTEIDREHAEFWCDRLEMAALMCDLPEYRIWLVATEGFTPDALAAMKARGAVGSSRRQAELLRRFLRGEFVQPEARADTGEHVEITIPMDENAELIAAGIVEELAKKHNYDPKSINQIKTALIEAFINAAEHSLSPDRKIYQRFDVDDRKFTVTISNRGIRLADVSPAANGSERAKRRGWGLELMRRLMDEVRIEETDDGTRIRMTKFAVNPD